MESQCYASYSNNVCSQTLFRSLTISQCCCGNDNTPGKRRAWGSPCMPCPLPNTSKHARDVSQPADRLNEMNFVSRYGTLFLYRFLLWTLIDILYHSEIKL